MPYIPNIHHRRSIRLIGYDYSQSGLYFITICVKDRACLLGEIKRAPHVGEIGRPTIVGEIGRPTIVGEIGRPQGHAPTHAQMNMNDAGKMIEAEWLALKKRFVNIAIHEFVVMPNHFHAILQIVEPVGAPLVGAQNVGAQNEMGMGIGRPQGHAPTGVQNVGAQNETDIGIGRPQGHAPTGAQNVGAQNEMGMGIGRPQGHAPTIGDMLDAFKSITTVEYIHGVQQLGWKPFNGKLWQRNYWEHIIRDEQSFQTISEYISNNPNKWTEDKFYWE